MCNKKQVADEANLIVNGYAFTKADDCFKVLNLNRDNRACVISNNGDILEASMDDVELSIVKDYFFKNRKYLEGDYYA